MESSITVIVLLLPSQLIVILLLSYVAVIVLLALTRYSTNGRILVLFASNLLNAANGSFTVLFSTLKYMMESNS